MRRSATNDLIHGSIVRALTRLAIPIVVANVLQTTYQLTDTFWLGRLGKEALAAVSVSFPIMFLVISVGMGLSIAGTILVAQYKGQGNREQINYIAMQTLVMMLLVSAVLSVIGFLLAEPIIHLIGVEAAVLPGAVEYLRYSFVGTVALFGFFTFQSLMRGVGDVTTPMFIVLGTVLLNLVLDPLFIFGWGPVPALGVGGAAIATLGTQGTAMLVGLWLISSGRAEITLPWKRMRPDWPLVRRLVRLGIPASIESSTRASALTVLVLLVSSFGTDAMATYGIGSRILSLVVIPAIGLGMATSTLVGQNIGANQPQRANRTAALSTGVGFIVLTGVGVILFLAAEAVSAIFIPDDPAIIASSARMIQIMALTFGFIAVQQVLNGAFQGGGNPPLAMMLSVISLWVLRFPLAYFLSNHTPLGADGLWWAFPITNVISGLLGLAFYLRGRWMRKVISETPKAQISIRSSPQPIGAPAAPSQENHVKRAG